MTDNLKETVGVNEIIRKPPIIENVNDPDSMIRMEGQMMGRLGESKRSWFMIILMWVSFGGPIFIYGGILLIVKDIDLPIVIKVILAIFSLAIGVIAHLPVYQAIKKKFSD